MSYLRGFLPWITFAAVSTLGWQWGALAGLLAGLWLLVRDGRAGVAGNARILETGTIVFFAALTSLAFAEPHSQLRPYVGTLSFTWLAVVAWGGLVLGRPFTLGIARSQAPAAVWEHPAFLRINRVLTGVWALAFTLTAAALAVCTVVHAGSFLPTACQVAGFALPAAFTARYPKRAAAGLRGAARGADR
ncbi:hypothetical protein ACFXOM_30030 [Streptomyces sp. NPDC059169]|uniref:hypothetical protein n=1 Tax=Streptomyces sp. NPDC059169 TaxID=3346754 RepID=UPI0036799E9C